MRVIVQILEASADEQEALVQRLAEVRGTAEEGTPGYYAGIEEVYAEQIISETAERVQSLRDARVAARRTLGEVLDKLPVEDQRELVGQLLQKAAEHGIDVSALVEGGQG